VRPHEKLHLERTSEALVGHGGLAAVVQLLCLSCIDDTCLHRESPNTTIKDHDILRSICGLLAQGKTVFDHIRQFSCDEFFPLALGLNKVPSSETLRQRFEKIAQDQKVMEAIKVCSRLVWKNMQGPGITACSSCMGDRPGGITIRRRLSPPPAARQRTGPSAFTSNACTFPAAYASTVFQRIDSSCRICSGVGSCSP